MPKRVIDADAMWSSDKLAACAEWAQAEYAWLYGLADASGSFELTNLRVIWGRVAAIRRNFTIERLEQVFEEFGAHGLLFRWESSGKRFGHWTGSDVPGRLPAPSWRARLEKLAPPVPRKELAEYVARFSCGPKQVAASESEKGIAPGIAENGLNELNPRLEPAQAQDLNLSLNWNQDAERGAKPQLPFPPTTFEERPRSTSDSKSNANPHPRSDPNSNAELQAAAARAFAQAARSLDPWASRNAQSATRAVRPQTSWWQSRRDAKGLQLARDLKVGRGPQVSPVRPPRDLPGERTETNDAPAPAKSAASGR
ncbi:MAG: hypothetical protein WA871_12330 [Candidatus Acidiferrales bacterium]